MAITKNPKKKSSKKSVDDFIEKKENDGIKQISLSLKESMLGRVDSCSADLGISRAGFIKQAVARALKMEGY
jgi:hypothetical protein